MKRIIALALMLVILVGAFSTGTGFASAKPNDAQNASNALSARLEHMLSLNYNFDKDFKSDAAIIENSMIALSSKADDDGFISRKTVMDFINNMYGYEVDENALDYESLPKKDGCYFIIPRGYTSYTYEITEMENYSGGVVAKCRVFADQHDGEAYSFNITVDFIENPDSCFGYNIASCVINRDAGLKI